MSKGLRETVAEDGKQGERVKMFVTVAYKTFTFKTDVVSVDIQTMAKMSAEEYAQYIRDNFWVDHHDVLREQPAGGYPLAVTQPQIRALIEYLEEIAPKVGLDA